MTVELVSYMVAHPLAKDTPQGIRKWWLHAADAQCSEQELRVALDELVIKGWLLKREAPSSQTIYRVNTDHLEAMKQFLRRE